MSSSPTSSSAASTASGLALSIRKAEESETFDLGGQNVTTIANTIRAAFSDPLPLQEMIRITFVTGAGKLGRQKYDEGAARAVTSTLRELSYEEDRAASCVLECAGSFKLQHDTGKNLKTVVVFPKITGSSFGSGQQGDGSDAAAVPSLVPEGCPAHSIAMSSMNTFERMLRTQCPSWSQKKGCCAALEHLKHMVDELDAKLVKGTPLDAAEQEFYDQVTSLDDKIAHAKDEMHKQVEAGMVTQFEKDAMLKQNAERIGSVEDEISKCERGSKKEEKLKDTKSKLTARKKLLQDISPKPPPKLRHEQAIARLWKEAVPLLRLEQETKGRLLSVKETKSMARKDEIMEEIESLENASRGWFEDESAFDARVQAVRATHTAKLNKKSNPKSSKVSKALSYASVASSGGGGIGIGMGGIGLTSGSATMTTSTSAAATAAAAGKKDRKWVTPAADSSNNKNAWGLTNKKKNKVKGSGVFAAMMAKGDDDDDDWDDHDNDDGNDDDEPENDHGLEEEMPTVAQHQLSAKQEQARADATADGGNAEKKKGGKKKKKNKKSNSKKSQVAAATSAAANDADYASEDELLNATAAANAAAAAKEKEEQRAGKHWTILFLLDYVLPAVLAILTWIVSLLFGKPKQKKR